MKKVLGIVGSPRRQGNTHLLVAQILAGAQAAGAEADLLFLNDLQIRECDGCHACWRGKPCSKGDAMNAVYPRLAASDVLVLGTPVYWYGPTALMKGFVDRLVYFNSPAHRPEIRGKKAILAIPFEEPNLETAALVTAFFEKSLTYLELQLVGSVVAPGLARKGEILEKADRLQAGYELGKRAVTESEHLHEAQMPIDE